MNASTLLLLPWFFNDSGNWLKRNTRASSEILRAFSFRLGPLRYPGMLTKELPGSLLFHCINSHFWLPNPYHVTQSRDSTTNIYLLSYFCSFREIWLMQNKLKYQLSLKFRFHNHRRLTLHQIMCLYLFYNTNLAGNWISHSDTVGCNFCKKQCSSSLRLYLPRITQYVLSNIKLEVFGNSFIS